MISFIVIGRNEGWKLSKCLQSIEDLIEYNSIKKFEIIYVDSDSNDDSIKRAKQFNTVKIFGLTGDKNAAIARNVGAMEATGEVLFFIDGDMQIDKNFLPKVYSEGKGLIENFVSGQWVNYYYDHKGKLKNKEDFVIKENDQIQKTTGGLFLIKKTAWDLVGGMKNEFRIGEDADLGLRLARNNIFLLRKKELAAIHHTIDYLDEKRKWKDFFNWNHLYDRSVLYRKHFFNRHVYQRLFRSDYSVIILVMSIISMFLMNIYSLLFILFYFIILVVRCKFNLANSFYYFLRDVSVLIGFFVFYVKNKKLEYKRIF